MNESRDNIDELITKGLELSTMGKHDEAESYFERVVSIDPNLIAVWIDFVMRSYPDSLYAKALDAFVIGVNDKKAITILNDVLKIHPKSAYFLFSKSIHLVKIKRYDEAMSCFNKSVEICDNVNVLIDRGYVLLEHGMLHQALLFYEKAAKIEPHHHLAMFTISLIKSHLDEKKESYDYLKKAIDLNPDYKEQIKKMPSAFKNMRDESQFIKLVS